MKPLAGDFLDVSGKFYGNLCFHFSFLDQFEREIKGERGNSVIHGGAVKLRVKNITPRVLAQLFYVDI